MIDKESNYYCVIMAGGVGSRFWPLSRSAKPKQFIDALGIGKTFIQMTYERFARFIPAENFLVVTGEAYRDLVREQLSALSDEQILTEPCRRNTAPCVAYASFRIKAKNPDAIIIVSPSDHYIHQELEFVSVMQKAMVYAAQNSDMVTVGIKPTYPATGYGYIQKSVIKGEIVPVRAFKEKPDLKTAVAFLNSGEYVWNSGMFVWSARTICEALKQYVPDIAGAFASLPYYTANERNAANRVYEQCRSISIDYAVMEQARNTVVIDGDFGWSDIGTWGSLYEHLDKDADSNARIGGDVLYFDTYNTLVKEDQPDKLLVLAGLNDYVLADTQDVLLVCPKRDEAELKQVIESVLKQRAGKQ